MRKKFDRKRKAKIKKFFFGFCLLIQQKYVAFRIVFKKKNLANLHGKFGYMKPKFVEI